MWENKVTTEAGRLVSDWFYKRVDDWITPRGIFPFPIMVKTAEGIGLTKSWDKTAKCFETFFRACAKVDEDGEPIIQAAIFGFDRRTTPEMRIETDSVLTCILYEKISNAIALVHAHDCFKFGIIPYQYSPMIVKPIDWNNQFWLRQMRREMEGCVKNVIVGRGNRIHLHDLGDPNVDRI